jgi:hypothetical protein
MDRHYLGEAPKVSDLPLRSYLESTVGSNVLEIQDVTGSHTLDASERVLSPTSNRCSRNPTLFPCLATRFEGIQSYLPTKTAAMMPIQFLHAISYDSRVNASPSLHLHGQVDRIDY